MNTQADDSPEQLRISLDAKVPVKIGKLSRGGKNRVETQADDHDFNVKGKLTPVGIYQPKEKDLYLYMVSSKTTSDCYVDILESWWAGQQEEQGGIKRLVINLDNGPEQNSHRTQFMKRMQEFSDHQGIEIQLAYYPPYHSKYNPIEHTFGTLEQHWSGELLDSEEKVVGYAKSMQWAGKNPFVMLVKNTYESGVKVAKDMMRSLNKGFERKHGIEKWAVLIKPRGNIHSG